MSRPIRLVVEVSGPNFRGHAFHRYFVIKSAEDALRAFLFVAKHQRRPDVSDVVVFTDGLDKKLIVSMLPAYFERS